MIRLRTIEKGPDGRITPADYQRIRSFWADRGYTPPERQMLPTLGIIAELTQAEAATPAACGFLYLDATGSGVAWLSWTATSPEVPRLRAGRALQHVLNFLEAEAQALGYWLITATLADPGFITLMQRRGYGQGDTGLCHLFKCQDAGMASVEASEPET